MIRQGGNAMCECVENKIKEEVRMIMGPYKQEKDNLIQILNEIQEKYGYIPKVAQIEISKYLNTDTFSRSRIVCPVNG